MEELFGAGAVLFEDGGGEDSIRIECLVDGEGRFRMLEEFDGELARWSFGMAPYRIETTVGPEGTAYLAEALDLDGSYRLPAYLRMQVVGPRCGEAVRDLLVGKGITFVVRCGAPSR